MLPMDTVHYRAVSERVQRALETAPCWRGCRGGRGAAAWPAGKMWQHL